MSWALFAIQIRKLGFIFFICSIIRVLSCAKLHGSRKMFRHLISWVTELRDIGNAALNNNYCSIFEERLCEKCLRHIIKTLTHEGFKDTEHRKIRLYECHPELMKLSSLKWPDLVVKRNFSKFVLEYLTSWPEPIASNFNMWLKKVGTKWI